MGPKDWGRTARGVQKGGRVKFTLFLIYRASISVLSSNAKEEIPNKKRKRSEEAHTRGFAALSDSHLKFLTIITKIPCH